MSPQRNGQKVIDRFGKTDEVVDRLNSTTPVGDLRMSQIRLWSIGFSHDRTNSLGSVKLWIPYVQDVRASLDLEVGAGLACNLEKSLPDRN